MSHSGRSGSARSPSRSSVRRAGARTSPRRLPVDLCDPRPRALGPVNGTGHPLGRLVSLWRHIGDQRQRNATSFPWMTTRRPSFASFVTPTRVSLAWREAAHAAGPMANMARSLGVPGLWSRSAPHAARALRQVAHLHAHALNGSLPGFVKPQAEFLRAAPGELARPGGRPYTPCSLAGTTPSVSRTWHVRVRPSALRPPSSLYSGLAPHHRPLMVKHLLRTESLASDWAASRNLSRLVLPSAAPSGKSGTTAACRIHCDGGARRAACDLPRLNAQARPFATAACSLLRRGCGARSTRVRGL